MAYRRVAEGAESVVDQAVTRIREGIRRGDYVPGQRLVAAELSGQLEVSINAVREALTKLAGEGLVEIQPHRGAVVRSQSKADILEIFELREMVEGLAARLAARAVAGGASAEPVLAAARLCHEHAEAPDFFAYGRANEAFHEAIYTLAGRERVSSLARQLSIQIDRLNNLRLARVSVLRQSCAEHDAIAQAIAAGKQERAEQAMREHVAGSLRKVIGDN